ncbi:hypothetical protein BH11ACT8_BH11ACT8_11730 [soil metagenome]
MSDDYSAITAMTGGDPQLARHLRASLAVIARRTDDPELRDLVVSVLQGRTSVRRVFEHPAFHRMASTNIDNLQQGLDQLPADEREALLSQAGEARTPEEVQLQLMEDEPFAEQPEDPDGPDGPHGTDGTGEREHPGDSEDHRR